MADYEGNVLRAPSMGQETRNPDVEELLGSTVGYTQKGGTVKKGAGVLEVGTPVKYNASTQYWEKATAADAEGFNRNAVDVSDQDMLIDIVLKGTIKLGVKGLQGVDKAALAETVNGRVITAFNWLTF